MKIIYVNGGVKNYQKEDHRSLRICLRDHHFSFPWRMLKILMSQDLFQNALKSIFLSLCFIIVYALLFTIFEKRAENRTAEYLKSYNGRWILLNFLGSLSNDGDEGKENRKKQYGQIHSKTITLHVLDAFLYIALPSQHDHDVKLPNFSFSKGRDHKKTILNSYFNHIYSPLEFYSTKIHQHLTN